MHQQNPDVWIWTDWPAEYQDPHSAAVQEFARQHRVRVRFFKFLQWQLDAQLAGAQAYELQQGMRIGLYHDLALATDRYGADLWAHRELYISGCRVGAPPDDFAPNGQDWGFPPPNREAHRANELPGCSHSPSRNSARHGGALRIDHVMRFFRPVLDSKPASSHRGRLRPRDFDEDLLGIVALESVRNGFIVVGEDLGTVAPEVRYRLIRSRAESSAIGCCGSKGTRTGPFARPATIRRKPPFRPPCARPLRRSMPGSSPDATLKLAGPPD